MLNCRGKRHCAQLRSIFKENADANSIGLEMYDSMTPFDYKDKYQTYREDAGTEDYSSDFVKLLLRHIKKKTVHQ